MGKFLIPLLGTLCLLPVVPSALALLLGIAVALAIGNPYLEQCKKLSPRLLAIAIVGLGFGMNLETVASVGRQGFAYTLAGLSLTLVFGLLFGRALRVPRDISLLVTVGTAICGGSAIAAVSGVIRAKSHDIAAALGTVFLLNAFALIIFPPLGHYFGLSETQFGLWAALAIHDTSSVVGAAMQFGPHALEVGATVKLARALWIVPLALLIGLLRAREGGHAPFKKPWFIFGFLAAAALVTWAPAIQPVAYWFEQGARRLMVLTLFLIGAGLTKSTLRAVGAKPFVQGMILWICVSALTLAAIAQGYVG